MAALVTALRAQIAADGHTHDCGHMRAAWPGLGCVGPCLLAREALRKVSTLV